MLRFYQGVSRASTTRNLDQNARLTARAETGHLSTMCGVFGIAGNDEAAKLTYLGLHALQHRGQESAGLVVAKEDNTLARHAGIGLVADVFTESALADLEGDRAVGHVRYSTAGGTDVQNAQPMVAQTMRGPIAIAHNGNLTNALEIRRGLERDGAIFSSRSDTEVVLHLLARARAPRLQDRLREALAQVEGAYSLLIMQNRTIVAVRDPSGFRPLVIGKVRDAYVLASETTALDLIEGELVREVEPGEMVTIDEQGRLRSEMLVHDPDAAERKCIFELIYFAKPSSRVFDKDVYEVRHQFGRQLAIESPVDADLVVPVPDSGVSVALGYAEQAGLPFRHGLLRSHYVGRTFIEPAQAIRHFGVKLKLTPVRSVLAGKRVIVVDDSIVRGTTSRKIVSMIRAAGAREVHLRISSPPTKSPCFYGIDTPTKEELIANQLGLEDIAQHIGADSLSYLSEQGLHSVVGDEQGENQKYCNSCFTGRYSVGNFNELLPIAAD